jgi:hypothetical protein
MSLIEALDYSFFIKGQKVKSSKQTSKAAIAKERLSSGLAQMLSAFQGLR